MTSSPDALHSKIFRPVPRTGVIYVMHEAAACGYTYGDPDWSNLGQGAPETGPLPDASPRIETIELDVATHEYAPVGGLPALREAVAELYNARYRRGMPSKYTPENVAICAGGRLGLTRVVAAVGPVHLGHVLPDYTAYGELLGAFESFVPIPIVLARHDGFYLEPERLRSEIVGKGLGAFLMSNPCNPTGQVIRGGALRAMVDVCRQLHCSLIVDEFYSHFLYGDLASTDGPALSACRYVEDVDHDPVVILDGLTKNWRYPGWRLSWTLGPRHIIERVVSAGSFLDGGPPHPVQRAALPLVEPEVADREARAIQRVFREKRRVMMERARGMGLHFDNSPLGAFYGFASLENMPEELRDGMAFFRAGLARQVITVPGEFFDVDPGRRRSHIPSRLKHHVRLSFGPPMDELERGLRRLDELIREA